MKKVLLALFVISILIVLNFASGQDTGNEPFDYDEPINLRVEHFRKNEVDLQASCHTSSTEYNAGIYQANAELLPATYPDCNGERINSSAGGTTVIDIVPEPEGLGGIVYKLEVWDFDVDGNGIVEPGEWIDANGNGVVDSGEWMDGGVLYLRLFKRQTESIYKEIDYDYYIKPTMPPKVAYYPKSYDHVVSGNAPPYGVPLTSFLTSEMYYDANNNGFYDDQELIVIDNGNGYFDGADTPITGSPPLNALLTRFKSIERYYDSNASTTYDPGEPIVQDLGVAGIGFYTDMTYGYKVIALHFKKCKSCADYVGDVAYYEDEYVRMTINFAGIIKETKKEKLGECEGCFRTDVTSKARLQLSGHKKFTMVLDLFDMHNMEYSALPDHFVDSEMDGMPDEISNGRGLSYYYSLIDENDVDIEKKLDSERKVYQVAAFDPYYFVIKNNRELFLYETDYGEVLKIPHAPPQSGVAKTEIEKWAYVDYTDTSGNFTTITLFRIFAVNTQKDGEVWTAKLLFTTRPRNALPDATTEEVYSSYYYVEGDYYKNDIIFPDCADFGVIVEKIDLENEKVWLKFIRKVDTQNINYDDNILFNQLGYPQINILSRRDIQIVFDEFDRLLATKCCEFPLKQINRIPKYEKVLVDITTVSRNILNSASLRYEDLKGYATSKQYYEEQPQIVITGQGPTTEGEGTRVTAMDILKYGAVYDGSIICGNALPAGDVNCPFGNPPRTATKTPYFMLKYVDANLNGTYDPGETVVVDGNVNSLYGATEMVYYGIAPAAGTPLVSFGWNISMPNVSQDVTYGEGYAYFDSSIVYTITSRNNGAVSIPSLVVTDVVPTNVTFLEIPPAGVIPSPGDPTQQWNTAVNPNCALPPPPGQPPGCGIRYRINGGAWQYLTNRVDGDIGTYDRPTRTMTVNYGQLSSLGAGDRIDVQYAVWFDPTTDRPALTGDGSLNGDTIINDGAQITYTENSIPGQSLTADPAITRLGIATISKTPNIITLTPPGSITYTIGLWQLSTTQTTIGSPTNPLLRVTDVIPAGTSYRTGSCVVTLGMCVDATLPTLTWQNIPSLIPPGSIGNVATMTYIVDVPPNATGLILNTAQLLDVRIAYIPTPLTDEEDSNNTQVTLIQPRPSVSAKDPDTACVTLSFEKTVPSSVIPGSRITYIVRVTNSQSADAPYSDAFNLTIVDPIPANTTYVPNSMIATINGADHALTDAADVEDPERYFGGFYDPTTKTVSLNLKNLPAGGFVSFQFSVTVEDVPINQYIVRAYVYDYFSEKKSSWIGLGGILGKDEVKITPDDTTKYMYDTIYTQVYENSNRKDRYPLKAFEKKIYDNAYYVDYNEFNEEEKTAFFDISKRSLPKISVEMRTAVYDKISFVETSSEVMSEDEFILYVMIMNTRSGMAHDFEYVMDASAFSPQNITWIHDVINSYPLQQPPLDVYGGERQTLEFLMKAPSVKNETTFPVKIKLKWKDDAGKMHSLEKAMFINVKHQKRGQVEIVKHIVEGKNKTVSEDTKTEKVSLNVGEKRTIHVYLRNTSDKKISDIRYMEIPPRGVSIVEGSREWKGSLEAGQSADFIFKIEATQTGVYQLQARASYEQAGQIYEATSNLIEISVVGEKGPTIEKETDGSTTEKGGIITVVIKVANDTKKVFKNIQVIEVVPKGFLVEEILTKGLTKKDDILTYQIDELKPEKYLLLKYTLKAGNSPGIYSFLGTRAVYEDSSKVKQEITSTDTELNIMEDSKPSLAMEITTQEREPLSSQEENVTMIVEILNEGGIQARDIIFTLPIPETTQYVDSSGTPLKNQGGLTYKIDYINPGDTHVVKYTFKALHTTEDRNIRIGLEARYTDQFRREYNTRKETTVTIEAKKPLVKISRALDKNTLKVNYPFIVTTAITNEGDSQASVDFRDELPEGFRIITGQNAWTGTLKPGDAVTVTYEVMANKVGIYQLAGTAKAIFKARSGTEYTATLTEDDTQKLTVQGVLVTKSVDRSTPLVDELTVVTVTIENIYREKATAIKVKDSPPSGAELVEGATEWTLEKLEPDEKVVYTYTIRFKTDGEISLPAALTSFADVYGDRHETLSDALVVKVAYPEGKKPTPPPQTTAPPETEPPRIVQMFRFQGIWIIVLIGILLVAGMIAILFIEQRKTEKEEERERIEQLTPEQLRAELWRRIPEEKKELPSERRRPPREGLPPRAFTGEEEKEEKKPSFLDRILRRKPEAEEEVRAPPILRKEERKAPEAITERLKAERIRKERAREITGARDIREVIEKREEEIPDLRRLIYGEEKEEEKIPTPKEILKEKEPKREAPPSRPARKESAMKEEEFVTPSIIEKFRKKEEEVEEPKSLRELIEEREEEPEKREIKEIKRPSYLERILAKEKEEVPKTEEEKPKRRLEDILRRPAEEKKPQVKEEEDEEDELPDPKDLLKKNGNNNKKN